MLLIGQTAVMEWMNFRPLPNGRPSGEQYGLLVKR